MEEKTLQEIKIPPKGFAVLALVGPSIIWCAEYIGSGEVILATRTGAILGTGILWAVILGIFLKFWIGLCGARYTVCTGEGMIDMFDRVPGPSHWVVWIVLVVQFAAATLSIGSIATAAGIFLHSLIPIHPNIAGWIVSFFALAVAFSGVFNILKIVMSVLVFIIVSGVFYVAAHVFPSFKELLYSLSFHIPQVPEWAISAGVVKENPWQEVLPLIGWGAGGFASQVWYTYWVLGAGYGACKGRGYGKGADIEKLKNMSSDDAKKIKGWCRVLYTDATIAMVIGITVTCCFVIAGAGILAPRQSAPKGSDVAMTLSTLFSSKWGQLGGTLFLISGTAALISTLIGQLAGWPRLLADSFRLCLPRIAERFSWKKQFRFFLIFFFLSNMIIVFKMNKQPVAMVQFSAILDGLVLTPLQALWVAIGLVVVLPKILSAEALNILKPHWILTAGLIVGFLIFGYFCIFQIPTVL